MKSKPNWFLVGTASAVGLVAILFVVGLIVSAVNLLQGKDHPNLWWGILGAEALIFLIAAIVVIAVLSTVNRLDREDRERQERMRMESAGSP